jgi:hypothetical protein
MVMLLRSIFGLAFCRLVAGWWGAGHMLVASIAKANMHPETILKVDSLLSILATDYPQSSSFIGSARWADDIKSQALISFETWHYENFAISADGTECKFTETEKKSKHALWALDAQTKAFTEPATQLWNKAFAIRFVIHIVGDLHQPLHAVSRCSASLPTGDAGGNFFEIIDPFSNKKSNLHGFWDSAGGQFPDIDDYSTEGLVPAIAQEIMQEYPASSFENFDPTVPANFTLWALESLALARDVSYNLVEGSRPDQAYIDVTRNVTRSQIAIAGFRLAALLESILAGSIMPHTNVSSDFASESSWTYRHVAGVFMFLGLICFLGLTLYAKSPMARTHCTILVGKADSEKCHLLA